MKKRLLMILLVVALLVTAAVFAVQANNTGTTANANKCPCGDANCTLTLDNYDGWTELTADTEPVDGGHYYAKDTTVSRSSKLMIDGKTVVILLDNATLTCTADNYSLHLTKTGSNPNPNVYIIGKNGAKLTGKSLNSSTGYGGIICAGAGHLHLNGDLTVERAAGSTNQSKAGSLIYAVAWVTVDGATLNGHALTGTASGNDGGTVYLGTNGKLIMKNGQINGVNAYRGGAVFVTGGSIEMTGGTITGAITKHSGSIHLASGSVSIQGGTVQNGKATSTSGGCGGNIYMQGGTLSISGDAKILNGETCTNGGNIYASSGTFTMTGGTVSGGQATSGNAGNIYLAGGTGHSITGGAVKDGTADAAGNIQTAVSLNLSNCTISGGKATGAGGQMIITGGTTTMSGNALIDGGIRNGVAFAEANAGGAGGMMYMANATFDMQGGTIQGCASSGATGVGGVANMNNSTFKMSGDAKIILSSRTELTKVAGIVASGTSSVQLSGNAQIQGLGSGNNNTFGYAVYLDGANSTVSLAGNASVIDADNTFRRNINASGGAKVTIANGWNGTASILFPVAAFEGGTASVAEVGDKIGTSHAEATAFTGKLYAENVYIATKDLTPQVLVNNGQLQVAATYIQDAPSKESIRWYLNNAAAVAAYEEGDVIKLITTEALDLAGKTVYVDFGGLTVDVTANGGKLYGIDTATGFTGAAAATATGVAAEPFAVDPLTGITYVAKDGKFYPIQVRNDGYGLRTNDMGIYFNAVIDCNPAIQNCIVGYGIDGTLDESFGIDNYLTGGVEDQYPTGGAFYGYINGIMGAGVGNDAETGVAPILTRLWVKLSNGSAEQTIYGADRAKSFEDVMVAINSSWGSLVDSHATVLDMYETYYDVMSTWDLTTIDDAYKAQN